MRKKMRQQTATVLGFFTSIVTALALIDFDAMDWSSINSWVKILVVVLPAVGGYLSEVSEKPSKNAPVQ